MGNVRGEARKQEWTGKALLAFEQGSKKEKL